MLLALLSDTHDNVESTRTGVALLKARKPHAWLHAGDLVSPAMLDLFAGMGEAFHFVFGNNEYDLAALRSRAKALNVTCHEFSGDVCLGGKRIGLLHGHEWEVMERMTQSGGYAYIIHGHTHVRRDERVGKTRIINPGALHRAKPRTVALLDVANDALEFLPVKS